VFTVLMLAADNLQELFAQTDTSVVIPELGEIAITADLDWTMEAVMNLMKNCMEHNAGGTVHCSYGQNPLYTEILIWDEGEGFARADLPHLFERFYRGENAGEGGIGIGLALAKEIVERQNGTIRAKNLAEGGACFEIHFYVRH
ncbi:MAG: sensor histidine kinase, partial [Lachnospiraceae bacterium]|nr:sensor histidine kinase [Lachnospiraceae bacterium]